MGVWIPYFLAFTSQFWLLLWCEINQGLMVFMANAHDFSYELAGGLNNGIVNGLVPYLAPTCRLHAPCTFDPNKIAIFFDI